MSENANIRVGTASWSEPEFAKAGWYPKGLAPGQRLAFFEYRFRGEDPLHGDNRALHQSWEDQIPLIYFHAVVPTVYQAIWPAFVTDWDSRRLSVHIVPGGRIGGNTVLPASIDTRRYIAVEAKRRLH